MRFAPGRLYHVYNRGNNGQAIFFSRRNYQFFLKKLKLEVSQFADILCYCLMPNHYHLLLSPKTDLEGLTSDEISSRLSRKLGTLQSSYSQAINKELNRSGSLFQQRVKSKELENSALICFHYIHQNPIKAGLVKRMEDWEFSSFMDYMGLRNDDLPSKELAFRLIDVPEDHDEFYKESIGVINSEVLDRIL